MVDLLTKFDGTSLTYDAIGNPLTYRDGMTMSWQGRQLKTLNNGSQTATYTYDADGLRATKTVGSVTTVYQYVGSSLYSETRTDSSNSANNVKLYYSYDAGGNLASIRYVKGSSDLNYYVVCNARGDVDTIYNAAGEVRAKYIYDSWGNTVSVVDANGAAITSANHIGLVNPIRYRGYYWDSESGFYYLQSRYYDPVTMRFINADSLVSTSQGPTGFNVFAYCLNNPVKYYDSCGTSATAALPEWLWGLGGVALADGPLPFGEVLLGVGIVVYVAIELFGSPYEAAEDDGDEAEPETNTKEGSDSRSLPKEAAPNSDQNLYDDEGNLKQKRHYGPDGKAQEDIDYKHQDSRGTHEFPHRHKWDWNKNPPRSGPLPMTK